MRRVAKIATGFVYYVSVTGVTGARDNLDEMIGRYVTRIRKYTSLPIGIGFGISKPDHVHQVATYAEAVIVGSAIIKVIEANLGKPEMLKKVGQFVGSLKDATRF
jgi:tryptophan synthase alpha chain